MCNSGLSHGNRGMFPDGIQQCVQVFFVGKAADLLLSVIADYQIAQGALNLTLLGDARKDAMKLILPHNFRQ